MQNKKKGLLKPKYDVVFQALFGENYKDLNKTIGILITNYEIKELKEIEKL